ncbi:hypothetical protein [Bifidobacterium callitrichidarum]|uniref:Uncharacterized protein n=1 Tax=Bifidobacterium callitrichidarum TaxID=2052941 RepID=A0A2U2N764_9BIFI|nr:hypothetical protein [Bifidobacterium callitrichidarum]PWG65031.1 hypothetical protein DF196_07760 [Bifidobacterium callitrichidarum]
MSPSPNILRYGPVSNENGGDTATVDAAGALSLSGQTKVGWSGLKWEQDMTAFPPGETFQLGCDNLPANTEILVRFNGQSDNAHQFLYPVRGDYAAGGVIPKDATSVLMAVRRAGTASDFTAQDVRPMVNLGETLPPWRKPDVTDGGGATL